MSSRDNHCSCQSAFGTKAGKRLCLLLQAFMGEIFASFFFIFVLFGMVIDKRWACADLKSPASDVDICILAACCCPVCS